jgi:hypothetical protein
LFFGCKKEPDNTVKPPEKNDTDYIDKSLKQNYLFNPGSKWVYYSEKFGFDSVQIIKQGHYFDHLYIHGIEYTKTEYYLNYCKSNIKDSFVDVFRSQLIMRNPHWDWNGWVGGCIFISWLTVNDSSFNEIKLLGIIDSMNLFGKTYIKVAKIQILNDENENNHTTYYYFTPHIGIIRKEIKDSITWDLYDYDIK